MFLIVFDLVRCEYFYLVFVKKCFVDYYFGESSVVFWEEYASHGCWTEYSVEVCQVHLVWRTVWVLTFFVDFWRYDFIFTDELKVLTLYPIIVSLAICPLVFEVEKTNSFLKGCSLYQYVVIIFYPFWLTLAWSLLCLIWLKLHLSDFWFCELRIS